MDNHAKVSEISQSSCVAPSGNLVAISPQLAAILDLNRLVMPFEMLVETTVDVFRAKNMLTIVEYQDPLPSEDIKNEKENPESPERPTAVPTEVKRECLIELQGQPEVLEVFKDVIKSEAFGFNVNTQDDVYDCFAAILKQISSPVQ